MTSSLYRLDQLLLVTSAGTRNPPWNDLASFGGKTVEPFFIFIINEGDAAFAESTDALFQPLNGYGIPFPVGFGIKSFHYTSVFPVSDRPSIR